MSSLSIQLSLPFWGCLYGSPKMEVRQLNKERYTLVLSSEAADIVIRKASTVYPNQKGWILDWRMKSLTSKEKGRPECINFESNDLKIAFGLYDININIDSKIKKAIQELILLSE